MNDMGLYGTSKKAESIFKITLSIILITGGLLISLFSSAIADVSYINLSSKVLSVTGIIANVVGFIGVFSWIMNGKDHLLPTKKKNSGL